MMERVRNTGSEEVLDGICADTELFSKNLCTGTVWGKVIFGFSGTEQIWVNKKTENNYWYGYG